ncbi:hypothetical protein [Pseudokineococcus sp. 1T1Z-3]|uniref:hypothetical protein n=1 Tax=Pseudokineococcus sp. 1T1Z-3 TaxID=3132745 RepID=UPI003094BC0E
MRSPQVAGWLVVARRLARSLVVVAAVVLALLTAQGAAAAHAAVPLAATAEPAPVEGDPDEMVDDPTTDGEVTARTRHLLEATTTAFPETSWYCFAPRPGTTSEHPLGRACDGTFGNVYGERPTPGQRDLGWEVAGWLQEHARVLGVQYVIWDGRIWSPRRDAEGWRPYDGGGLHDPDDVTGGHLDHLHVSVREGELPPALPDLGDLRDLGGGGWLVVVLLGGGVVAGLLAGARRSRRTPAP